MVLPIVSLCMPVGSALVSGEEGVVAEYGEFKSSPYHLPSPSPTLPSLTSPSSFPLPPPNLASYVPSPVVTKIWDVFP